VAGADEQREDELAGMQARLADQVAEALGGAQAAQAMDREWHYQDFSAWTARTVRSGPFAGTEGLDKNTYPVRINFI
jgi:hypothetical protein